MTIVTIAPRTCRDGNSATRRRYRGALAGGVQDVTPVQSGLFSYANTYYDVTAFALRCSTGGDGYVSR